MNIHEYQAKSVLEKYGVRVQRGVVVDDASQALEAAKKRSKKWLEQVF